MPEPAIFDYLVKYDSKHGVFARAAGEYIFVPFVQLSGSLPARYEEGQRIPLAPHVDYLSLARLTVANAAGVEADEVKLLTRDEVDRGYPEGHPASHDLGGIGDHAMTGGASDEELADRIMSELELAEERAGRIAQWTRRVRGDIAVSDLEITEDLYDFARNVAGTLQVLITYCGDEQLEARTETGEPAASYGDKLNAYLTGETDRGNPPVPPGATQQPNAPQYPAAAPGPEDDEPGTWQDQR
jgi:hypothetical protein